MKKKTVILAAAALVVAAVAFLVTTSSAMLGEVGVPTVRWSAEGEALVEEVDPLAAEGTEDGGEREILEDQGDAGARMEAIVRGRVLDRGGVPIAGAEVCLQYRRSTGNRNRGRRQVLEHVRTGGDGTFAFVGSVYASNLVLNLQVTHDRHAPTLLERGVEAVTDDVDLGDITMLSGGAVVGRVTDLAGNAIPGASLVLEARGRQNPLANAHDRRELLPTLESNSNGFFRTDNLLAAQYQIQASARNRQESNQRAFTIRNDQEHDLGDIKLGPGFEITGVVYAPDGSPVERASIQLRTTQRGRRFRDSTDAEGRFLIEHIPPGTLNLAADREGFLEYELADLDPAATPPLTIQLHEALQIRGTVTDAITGLPVERFAARARRMGDLPEQLAQRAQQGMEREVQTLARLLDSAQSSRVSPAEAARLEERRVVMERRMVEASSRMSGGTASPWPDDAGRVRDRKGGEFALTDLEEGVYVVDIVSPDHQRFRTEPVELRRSDPAPELEIALPSGLTIVGQVVADADGVPIHRARVRLRVLTTDSRGREDRDQAMDTRTDEGGQFRFAQLPPGLTYEVNTVASGHVTETTEPFVLAGNPTDLEIRLTATGVLEGTVLNIPPEQADDVRVMLVGVQGRQSKSVDAEEDGTYRIRDIVPGSYAIRAYLGRVRNVSLRAEELGINLEIRAGTTSTYNVPVSPRPLGQVQGIVLNNGQPGRGFRASLQSVTPGARRRTNTQTANNRGTFTFSNIALGSYELTVRGPDRRGPELYRQTVQVTPEGRIELRINLSTAHLRVQVAADEGTPALERNGRVRLYAGITELPQPGTQPEIQPVVNNVIRDGSFMAGALPPGPYLVLVEMAGRAPITRNLLLTAGGDTLVEISATDGR